MSYNPPPPAFNPHAGQQPQPPYGQSPYGQSPYGQPQQPQQPDPYNPYGQPYPQMPPPSPTQGRSGRIIGILATVCLLVLGIVLKFVVFAGASKVYHSATDADRNKKGEVTGSGNLDPTALKNGDCYHNAISSTTATETVKNIDAIPCTRRHDAQVFAVFKVPGAYPPSSRFEDLCKTRLQVWAKANPKETQVLTKLDPKWAYSYLFPKADLWARGDHTVSCSIVMNSNVLTRKLPVSP